MGLDPGYRTGCKVAVVDPTGKVLDTTVVYPTRRSNGQIRQRRPSRSSRSLSKSTASRYIAIGNGTAEPRDRAV